MAGLVSTTDLDNRGITYATPAQAQAAIDDASAAARVVVGTLLDDVETPDAPDLVVAIVCGMVRRALRNPTGLAQETLGDYSYSTGGAGVATLLPTSREKRLLRRAVGKLGASAIEMEAPMPLQPSEPTLDPFPEQTS